MPLLRRERFTEWRCCCLKWPNGCPNPPPSRLAYISMMEIRLLFNYTVFKKVMTPWQCGMCMMICYPTMLPDPNFLSCAILNVTDLDDIPWSKHKDLILAD